jgi:hypothetical protein
MNLNYFVFWSDGDYEQGSVNDHLRYLKRWGGTPQVWDGFPTLKETFEALDGFERPYVITDKNWKVVESKEEIKPFAFYVDPHHLAYLVRASESYSDRPYTGESIHRILDMLIESNQLSMQARYGQDEVASANYKEAAISVLENNYWPAFEPTQVISSVNCFEYQACNDVGWRNSKAYDWLMDLRGQATYALIKELTTSGTKPETVWGAPLPDKALLDAVGSQ